MAEQMSKSEAALILALAANNYSKGYAAGDAWDMARQGARSLFNNAPRDVREALEQHNRIGAAESPDSLSGGGSGPASLSAAPSRWAYHETKCLAHGRPAVVSVGSIRHLDDNTQCENSHGWGLVSRGASSTAEPATQLKRPMGIDSQWTTADFCWQGDNKLGRESAEEAAEQAEVERLYALVLEQERARLLNHCETLPKDYASAARRIAALELERDARPTREQALAAIATARESLTEHDLALLDERLLNDAMHPEAAAAEGR